MATISWVPDRRQVLLFTYELNQNPRFPDTETDREKSSVSSNSSSLQDLSLTLSLLAQPAAPEVSWDPG